MFALWALAAPSLADPVTIGLFVGSNRPGAGQEPLRYAMDDVERVTDVLGELGSLDRDRSVVLTDPGSGDVLEALEGLQATVQAREAAGDQTVFVFYYSGHAKREALSLGDTELSLPVLREQLEAMPSTVTLAFLDACQSGAFSRVKGIRPTESFSYQSAEVLPAEGLAVMASSTATELSQESDLLGGSYFTHHLVTGLRGPADSDEDGAVTFGEAYAYAQEATLVSTAATRTGSQHVTLETQLRGRGDLVLTRPRVADAWLALDVPWTGRMLVMRDDNRAVVAEVVKQEGAFRIAVPADRYRIVARNEDGPVACVLRVPARGEGRLSEAACEGVELPGETTVKAAPTPMTLGERRRSWVMEPVAIEYSFGGWGAVLDGPFYDTLDRFGFDTYQGIGPVHTGTIALRLRRRIGLALTFGSLAQQQFVRQIGQPYSPAGVDEYSLNPSRFGAYVRAATPLGVPAVVGYVQGGPGVTTARARYASAVGGSDSRVFWAPHLAGAVGLQFMIRTRTVKAGAFLQVEGLTSPIARNELGQAANVGGLMMQAGLRFGW